MALLTGLTADGQEVPVQVKPDGKLVAEGLTGPAGPIGPLGPVGPAGPQGPVGQDLPAGSLLWFAGLTTPAGWLYCNGQEVNRGTYAALFAVIGGAYGEGDGTHTFNVPDFRGIFMRGWDDARGVDPSRVFASYQGDSFQWHHHSLLGFYNIGSEAANQGTATGGGAGGRVLVEAAGAARYSSDGNGGNETRPKNLALRVLIRT